MYETEAAIVFLTALTSTLYLTKKFIHRFHEGGYVVKDMYKPEHPNIPTMGGLAIIGGLMVSLIAAEILVRNVPFLEKLLVFYFVVFVYGMFGLLDDLIRVKSRFKKVYILYFLALPIALLNTDTSIDILSLHIPLGWAYSFIIAPVYVMVVANLVNMHSGYNGLSSGLSAIILFFLLLKTIMARQIHGPYLLYLMPAFGAILAFYFFDRYPSRIIWGNIGSLSTGAILGGYIILFNLEFFGIVLLTPHILDFLLFLYLKAKKLQFVKFGKIREDNTIQAPNPYKLKFLLPYFFRLTEQQNVLLLYSFTIVFGVIAITLVP